MVPSFHAVCLSTSHDYSFAGTLFSRPLTILGNFVYNLANRLHLIPKSGGDIETGTYNQVPLSARAEAERRRCGKLNQCPVITRAELYLFQSSSPQSPRPTSRKYIITRRVFIFQYRSSASSSSACCPI
jgi:hypothetical protein